MSTLNTLSPVPLAQVFSLFNAVTCSSFLKALADAFSGGGGKGAAAGAEEGGSDVEMEDAEEDAPSAAGGAAGRQALCAEAIRNLAAALPLLSLKDQQDSLRKCVQVAKGLESRPCVSGSWGGGEGVRCQGLLRIRYRLRMSCIFIEPSVRLPFKLSGLCGDEPHLCIHNSKFVNVCALLHDALAPSDLLA